MKVEEHIIQQEDSKPIILDIKFAEGNEKNLIIFTHGFKGFKDWGHFNLMSEQFVKAGFDFLKFNFSHNGGTMEEPIDFPDLEAFGNNTFSIEQDDLNRVINWAKSNINPSNIFLIGHSRGGGAVLLKAANDKRITKLVTWASVSSFERWNKDIYDYWKREGVIYIPNARTMQEMPLYWILAQDYFDHIDLLKIEDQVERIKIPTLIIHGTNDEAVPYQEALNLHQAIKQSQMHTIESANHTFGTSHPWTSNTLPEDAKELIDRTIEFLQA
jgi:pimeloyl-ACP methyl ester carboxylesterase